LSRYSRARASRRHLKPDSQVEAMHVGVTTCLNSMSKPKLDA